MNKSRVIGLTVVLLLAATAAYFLFTDASSAFYTVASDDGLAKLQIPKNALPEGVTKRDISITNVSETDGIIAYELKPEGTVFSEELTFTATFKNTGNTIPIPIHISEEHGLELVSGATTSLDLVKKETTIAVPVTHFSVLTFPMRSTDAFFDATVDVPVQLYVGDVVTAKATLNKHVNSVVLFSELNPWAVPLYDDEKRLLLGRHSLGYRIAPDSVHVSGKVSSSFLLDAVGPYQNIYGYPNSSVFTGESLTVKSSDFRCEKVGTGGVYFYFDLTFNGVAVDVISGGRPGQILRVGSSLGLQRYKQSGSGSVIVGNELECVARPTVNDPGASDVSASDSRAVGDILNDSGVQATSTPVIRICGLPGGPACPPPR